MSYRSDSRNRRYFNKKALYILGEGCSRITVELEDGTVAKYPKINCDYEEAGSADYCVFDELLGDTINKHPELKQLVKLRRYINEGHILPASSKNNATEYLLSLFINDMNKPALQNQFALAMNISVSLFNDYGVKYIRIITRYENAEYKDWLEDEEKFDGYIENYRISDLHDGNFVNNVIVDYACIRYYSKYGY